MAFSGYSPPATNVSATNVSRLAQMGSGNCANPVAQTSETSETSQTPSDPSRRSTRRPDRAMEAQRHRRPRPERLRLDICTTGLRWRSGPDGVTAYGRPAVELGLVELGRHLGECRRRHFAEISQPLADLGSEMRTSQLPARRGAPAPPSRRTPSGSRCVMIATRINCGPSVLPGTISAWRVVMPLTVCTTVSSRAAPPTARCGRRPKRDLDEPAAAPPIPRAPGAPARAAGPEPRGLHRSRAPAAQGSRSAGWRRSSWARACPPGVPFLVAGLGRWAALIFITSAPCRPGAGAGRSGRHAREDQRRMPASGRSPAGNARGLCRRCARFPSARAAMGGGLHMLLPFGLCPHHAARALGGDDRLLEIGGVPAHRRRDRGAVFGDTQHAQRRRAWLGNCNAGRSSARRGCDSSPWCRCAWATDALAQFHVVPLRSVPWPAQIDGIC